MKIEKQKQGFMFEKVQVRLEEYSGQSHFSFRSDTSIWVEQKTKVKYKSDSPFILASDQPFISKHSDLF